MSKNIFDDLIAFEEGRLAQDEVSRLFQQLIDDGTVWRLQGSYGRTAHALIEDGRCMLGETSHLDYFGNHVPSRFEVQPGTPGSPEYVNARHEAEGG